MTQESYILNAWTDKDPNLPLDAEEEATRTFVMIFLHTRRLLLGKIGAWLVIQDKQVL